MSLHPATTAMLDPFAVDLTSMGLIEASAGTGKTYTLTSLYLRLLLEQGLLPEQILVMTFTEAATRELKDRIRRRLSACHDLFIGALPRDAAAGDPFLLELVRRHGDDPRARAAVVNALRSHDLAAIHTIHGFCHRVLRECAFESGVLFDVEPLADDGDLLQQVIDDFWRCNAPYWPTILHSILYELGCNVDSMRRDLHPVINHIRFNGPDAVLSGEMSAEMDFDGLVDQLAGLWATDHGLIHELLDHRLLLKSKASGNYRPETIAGWYEAIDHFFSRPAGHVMPMEAMRQFSTARLRLGTRKNKETPQHRFFDLADILVSRLEQAYRHIRRQCICHCLARLPEVKKQQQLLSYDDMLIQVRDGLLAGPRGRHLAERLRQRYPVGLIDEFQDTDPVQYAIFSAIYADNSGGVAGLFLIGDPKQAIYSFRGADIFAYLQAATAAPHHYALSINYRSEPGLIRAVNLLFTWNKTPFLLADLEYPMARAPDREQPLLRIDAEAEDASMIVWTFAAQHNRNAAKRLIATAVANEIARLIGLGRTGIACLGETPLAAGDIAVLVRTHRDGDLIREVLQQHGVRSVSYSQESVFKTDDAREIGLLLAAVLNPWDSNTLRATLTTSMLGWSSVDLQGMETDESLWGEVVTRFASYCEQWHSSGVAVMLQRLGQAEGVFQRLAAYPDGDRRMTNLRHLLELLQEAAYQHGYGPAEQVAWLRTRRHDAAKSEDDEQLRLESDEHLVKIVTIHKSKGLEYPVVFYPFPWDRPMQKRNQGGPVVFHDIERRPLLDLDSPAREAHARQQQTEALAEEMRLLYVALTRARNRCYLTCGRVIVNGSCLSVLSSLAMLLHPVDPGEEDLVASLKALGKELDDEAFAAPLHGIGAQSDGAVAVVPLPVSAVDSGGIDALTTSATILTAARHCSRQLATTSMVYSFSFLHQLAASADEAPDHDALPGMASSGPPVLMGLPEERSAFTFPRGARAGSCLHAILEILDFGTLQRKDSGTQVAETLRAFGFDADWTEPVRSWLVDVLRTPLDPALPGLCLERINRHDRLDELEFYYAMPNMPPTVLRRLFVRGAAPAGATAPVFGRSATDFMKGFIDLVCRFEERYYIIDYKSNFLGQAVADYHGDDLARVMSEAGYDLQYHIYTVALHRYLAARLADYDYDRHFGGVFYLFLRGMRPDAATGVFRARPDRAIIEQLDCQLAVGQKDQDDRG